MPSDEQLYTYQTRLKLDVSQHAVLENCAKLLCKVERDLFAALASGKEIHNLKSQFIQKYEITARHFNAIRVQLEGKIASIKERCKGQIVELKTKIAAAQKRVAKLEKSDPH